VGLGCGLKMDAMGCFDGEGLDCCFELEAFDGTGSSMMIISSSSSSSSRSSCLGRGSGG